MSERNIWSSRPANGETPSGGPLPPSGEKHSLGWKVLQVAKTIQARLRFFVLLAAVGGLLLYWDTLKSYYEKWTRPFAAQAAADPDIEYWCPMHPTVVRDHPDKCPICGMPLSKRKKSEGGDEALPAGVVSRVQLTPYRVALAGIQTEPVEYRALTKEITAAGFVEFDERKLTRISVHVSGRSRIDKLYVNVTDQTVNEGDPLALLYSPDLDTTMQNLLDARRGGNKELERMTRERLAALGHRRRPDRSGRRHGQADHAHHHPLAGERPRPAQVPAGGRLRRGRRPPVRRGRPVHRLDRGPDLRGRAVVPQEGTWSSTPSPRRIRIRSLPAR